MFTVVYTKNDGKVQGISSASYSDEDFLQAYGEDYARIETEDALPDRNQYRQYLAVENREVIVKDYVFTEEQEREVRWSELADEMNSLKMYLAETDYTVIKCSEQGLSMSEAYPEILEKRTTSRNRINEIEAELKELGY